MPAIAEDYSQTIIYKISCIDINIKNVYVGHTTQSGYRGRKCAHRNDCNNKKTNSKKVYTFINENGGWLNWEMIILERLYCRNNLHARERELYWHNKLHATLNSNTPLFISFDYELFEPSSGDKYKSSVEYEKFKCRKRIEELDHLRIDNKRLIILLLENFFKNQLKINNRLLL
jgi:hypothetical protein